MNTQVYYWVVLCIVVAGRVHGQVSIGLELGGSYAPFTLYAATVDNVSNRIDYIFGVNSQIHLGQRLLLNTRVSYVDREDFRWRDFCLCPDYLYSEYTQNDISLDFSTSYIVGKNIVTTYHPSKRMRIFA